MTLEFEIITSAHIIKSVPLLLFSDADLHYRPDSVGESNAF